MFFEENESRTWLDFDPTPLYNYAIKKRTVQAVQCFLTEEQISRLINKIKEKKERTYVYDDGNTTIVFTGLIEGIQINWNKDDELAEVIIRFSVAPETGLSPQNSETVEL